MSAFTFQPTILDSDRDLNLIYKKDQEGKWNVGMNITESPPKVVVELLAEYGGAGLVASLSITSDQFAQFKHDSNIKVNMPELADFIKGACLDTGGIVTLNVTEKKCFINFNGNYGHFMLPFDLLTKNHFEYFFDKINELNELKAYKKSEHEEKHKQPAEDAGKKSSGGSAIKHKLNEVKSAKDDNSRGKEKAEQAVKENETKREVQPAAVKKPVVQFKSGGWVYGDLTPALPSSAKKVNVESERVKEKVPASSATTDKVEKDRKEEKSDKKEKADKRKEDKTAVTEKEAKREVQPAAVKTPAFKTGGWGDELISASASSTKDKVETPRVKENGDKDRKEAKSDKKEKPEKKRDEGKSDKKKSENKRDEGKLAEKKETVQVAAKPTRIVKTGGWGDAL